MTALLAVLLALGIPAAASPVENASKGITESSDHPLDNSREESELDHDHGYGNDDKDVKDKNKDKDKDNSETFDETSSDDPVTDEEHLVDDRTVEEPAIEEPAVDEEVVVDDPIVRDEEPVLDDVVGEPAVDEEVLSDEEVIVDEETVGDDTPIEETELGSKETTVSEEPTIEKVLVEESDAATDGPSLVDVAVETVVPDTSSIIEVSLDHVKPVAPSSGNKAAVENRDESAADHDKGYGNDDKVAKNKDMTTPEVTPTNQPTPEGAPPIEEPAVATPPIVDVDAAPVASPTAEPADRDHQPTILRSFAPQPAGLIGDQPQTPASIRGDLPELDAAPLVEGAGLAAAVALTLDSDQWLPARPAPESSLMPLGRLLLPPAGVALVDLLAASDTRFVNPSGIDSVTEAAKQATGLVAIPAAALTALAMLGWAIKPIAIKAGSLFVSR